MVTYIDRGSQARWLMGVNFNASESCATGLSRTRFHRVLSSLPLNDLQEMVYDLTLQMELIYLSYVSTS